MPRDTLPRPSDLDRIFPEEVVEDESQLSTRELATERSSDGILNSIIPFLNSILERIEQAKSDRTRENIENRIFQEKENRDIQLLSSSVIDLELEEYKTVSPLRELLNLVKLGGGEETGNNHNTPMASNRGGSGGGITDTLKSLAPLALLAAGGKIGIFAAIAIAGSDFIRELMYERETIQRREILRETQRREERQNPQLRQQSPTANPLPGNITPQNASRYAQSLGHAIGTPEYNSIIEQANRNPANPVQQNNDTTPNPANPTQQDGRLIEGQMPTTAIDPMEPAAGQQTTPTPEPDQQAPSNLNFAPGVDPRINTDIANKVQQLSSTFSQRLTISSGYRDPARNARAGGARNSAHTRGNAVDLVFNGTPQDTVQLIQQASALGIGGIGVYQPGWVHLDTEGRRVWGRDFTARSIPQWARPALEAHMNGTTTDAERVTPSQTPTPEPQQAEPNATPIDGNIQPEAGETRVIATPEPQQPTMGTQVLAQSQENAIADRTPEPPTIIQPQQTPVGQESPGALPAGVFQSETDPGSVEPDDAAERYARLFNMAA